MEAGRGASSLWGGVSYVGRELRQTRNISEPIFSRNNCPPGCVSGERHFPQWTPGALASHIAPTGTRGCVKPRTCVSSCHCHNGLWRWQDDHSAEQKRGLGELRAQVMPPRGKWPSGCDPHAKAPTSLSTHLPSSNSPRHDGARLSSQHSGRLRQKDEEHVQSVNLARLCLKQ